jgi:uncharacterized membrane protein YheB (UPF0754 family)
MKFLIPIIVGATIGYFTNWLAIKMLFRPHYEKKFMGVVLPFTPGLIPKEKARISNNIGEAVGEHLLSPETITEALSSEKTEEQIRLCIESKINKLKNSEASIKEVLESLSIDGYKDINLIIKQSLISFISKQVQSEKFKSEILRFIEYKLNQDEFYMEIKEKLTKLIYDFGNSNEIEELLQKAIDKEIDKLSKDDRILKEVLPETVILGIDRYLSENSKKIAYNIRELISSPEIQNKLKISITTMVEQNISRLITSFISPEAISEKIFSAIWNYINNEDSNKDINLIIRSSLDKVMDIQVLNIMPELLKNIDSNKVSRRVLHYAINDGIKDNIVDIIDAKVRSCNKQEILNELSKRIDIILDSNEFNTSIVSFINDIVDQIMNKEISILIKDMDYEFTKIYGFTKIIFHNFVEKELPHIIKMFDVSKIVEDNINKFDVEFTEELILNIASKELKTITWLGALLGGILGLLSPLLQMI